MRALSYLLAGSLFITTTQLGCFSDEAKLINACEAAKMSKPIVALVVVVGIEGEGSGSAVAIGPDMFLTNAHVVDGSLIMVVEVNGKASEATGSIICKDADLAIIVTKDKIANSIVDVADSLPETGEVVFSYGCPLGFTDVVGEGLFNGVRDVGPEGKLILFNAPISRGSSGGALFNKHGQLIGITCGVLPDSQHMNFAVPLDKIREFAKKEGIILK